MARAHPLSSGTTRPFRGPPFPKEEMRPLSFSKSTQINTAWNPVYYRKKKKKSLLFWVFAFVNHFPTWSQERRFRMPRRSSCVVTAESSPGNLQRQPAQPLGLQPRWPRERAIREAVTAAPSKDKTNRVCALHQLISFWQ